MDWDKLQKAVSSVEKSLMRKTLNLLHGEVSSQLKGLGQQFKEFRPYQYGDDTRFIDWKILAKTGSPTVKIYEEERDIHYVVFMDCHPGMWVGHYETSKLYASIEIAALLFLLSEKFRDKVTVNLLTHKCISCPGERGRTGVAYLLRKMFLEGILDENFKENDEFLKKDKFLSSKEKMGIIRQWQGPKKKIIFLSDFKDWLVDENPLPFLERNGWYVQIISPLEKRKYWGPRLFDRKGNIYNISKSNITPKGDRVVRLDLGENYIDKFLKGPQ